MFKIVQSIAVKFLIVVSLSACSQKSAKKSEGIATDSTIISEVTKKIAAFNGQANANILFIVYENNKEVSRSSELGEAALSFTSFFNDTLIVDCQNGIDEGLGFSLIVSNDTSDVKFQIVSTDSNILFRTTKEMIPQPGVTVDCSSQSVLLAKRPSFTQGEIIEGKVQFETEPIYEVSRGQERLLTFKVVSFFRSEPLPINGGYRTLKRT
jgi:hypothetical protein